MLGGAGGWGGQRFGVGTGMLEHQRLWATSFRAWRVVGLELGEGRVRVKGDSVDMVMMKDE